MADLVKDAGKLAGGILGFGIGLIGAAGKTAYNVIATDKSINEIKEDAGKIIDECTESGIEQGEEHAGLIVGTAVGYGLNEYQDKKRREQDKLEAEKKHRA